MLIRQQERSKEEQETGNMQNAITKSAKFPKTIKTILKLTRLRFSNEYNPPGFATSMRSKRAHMSAPWPMAAASVVAEAKTRAREEFSVAMERDFLWHQGSSGKLFDAAGRESKAHPRLCLVWMGNC